MAQGSIIRDVEARLFNVPLDEVLSVSKHAENGLAVAPDEPGTGVRFNWPMLQDAHAGSGHA